MVRQGQMQELERTKRMTQAAQRAEMVDGGRAR
eukprot:COSAG01_NODE_44973_length_413_cov_43.286624_1_plen_32_part_01